MSDEPSESAKQDFDVEDLKVHKIAGKKDKHRHLSVVGQVNLLGGELASADEAFGGTGEAPAVAKHVLAERVVEALKLVFDPEIPLNVYDLGLIYEVAIEGSEVEIQMTLTAPACPVAGQIVKDVADRVGAVEGVSRSHVKLVWEPAWTKERMSDDALLELGLL